MFTNDIIKVMYVNMGYLPNYPYHMITDAEMVEAFIGDNMFFDSNYYCPANSLKQAHKLLKDNIKAVLADYLENTITEIPDWIYSYMLGNTTAYNSDVDDIEYLYQLTNLEPNVSYDTFDIQLATECYNISKEWLKKQSAKSYDRVPTMFGEPHVFKSLRLASADILTNG